MGLEPVYCYNLDMHDLPTSLPELSLVTPDPGRDAAQAVEWLKGDAGKETLMLMGNPEAKIEPPSLEAERERLEKFITLAREGRQLTWMMRCADATVGAIWVDLEPTKHLAAPAIHIMIGDPSVRGQGVGRAAMAAVIGYLRADGKYPKLYSRYLTTNTGSIKLLNGFGFTHLGPAYTDEDGLEFQNLVLSLTD